MYIFVAREYPESHKKVLEILNGIEMGENNTIPKDKIAPRMKEVFPEKKQMNLLMKFASFCVVYI